MALNLMQRDELRSMLNSETFKRAKEDVLTMSDGSVSELLAPEAAIKMSIEKGVRYAFRLLARLADEPVLNEPLQPRSKRRPHA